MTNPYDKQSAARVGATARKWTLDRLIAVGGMAAVYEATHRNGNRVAIKVLHEAYSQIAEAKERFLREGYVANQVGHVGAVTVLDDDELADGTPFLVMELLEGQSLEELLAVRKTLDVGEALHIADGVLDVLAAGHERSIIHRDIKPANLLLTTDGQVKVLDFGLARALGGPGGMIQTRTGTVIGTSAFMAPEQARGKPEFIDHRVDLWSVAATVFFCLAGRFVHEAQSPTDRLFVTMTKPAISLGEVVQGLPADVVELVDRALAFKKEDRWPDAWQMQAALRQVYEQLMGHPIPSAAGPAARPSWVSPEPAPQGEGSIEVSVSLGELESTGESVFVEFDDDDD